MIFERIAFAPIRAFFWYTCADAEWELFRDIMTGSFKSALMSLIFMVGCVIADSLIEWLLDEWEKDKENTPPNMEGGESDGFS